MTGRSRPLKRRIESHRIASIGRPFDEVRGEATRPTGLVHLAVPEDLVAERALAPDGRLLQRCPAQDRDVPWRHALVASKPVE